MCLNNTTRRYCFSSLLLLCLFSLNSFPQYFGRNKVLYQNFNFNVLESQHFDIYNYLNNQLVKNRFLQLCEQWYAMHQAVMKESLHGHNPLILYDHHAHFQETRAIDGLIDVGTGGVTEGMKNRIVMPFMESNAQTDHVLGHEMVHAFQYQLIKDSLNINALNNLPLWMVEGMAEYMSTGYVDNNTSMWLRSAVLNDKLPTLRDLTNRPDLYFPYRWGEAFWAYITGIYGDGIIKRLFMETAKRGYPQAIKNLFKLDEKTLSKQWQESIIKTFTVYEKSTQLTPIGQCLVNRKNAGNLNILPAISPNGKYMAFWTEKNLFSLDLYIANANTGTLLQSITSNSFRSHVDQYSFYESSVTWSPDSKQLAFVAFSKGRNKLLIAELNGKITQEIELPGVTGFSNPAWSPDGHTIVVTGIVEGQIDLYTYDLRTKKVRQLTNDLYSDLEPSWSSDGKSIVFATDQLCLADNVIRHNYTHNIALLNIASGAITNLDFFPGANNLNPVFAPDNKTIYFLSDRDGFRNLYEFNINKQQLLQLTNLYTGISGITSFAPAISTAYKSGALIYTYYDNNRYSIYKAYRKDFQAIAVNAMDVSIQSAIMPPVIRKESNLVQPAFINPPVLIAEQKTGIEVPYQSKFGLDFLGNTGAGVQFGAFGPGLAGGVNGIFSDILGNHQLYGALLLNGEILDVAGQFVYLNQKHRFNWGATISHIPYLSGSQYLFRDTLFRNEDTTAVLNYSLDLLRTFEDQLSVFASYPFSTVKRIEAGASFGRYYYRMDRYTDYYDITGTYYLGGKKTRPPVPKGFNLMQAYVAFVGDNSFFGVASPLEGHRFRIEAGHYAGLVDLSWILADYRKYIRIAPVTFALRNMYTARFGKDAGTSIIPPLFIGYPGYIRGYEALTYANDNQQLPLTINALAGSSMYVSNAEFRLPVTGPEKLSVVKSRFFMTELNLFTDGGIAWGNSALSGYKDQGAIIQKNARFILSSGISLRVNLFGYLVIEPYYAIPWQNGGFHNRSFGLNFLPGW